jgi:hypothetical protein
MGEFPMTISRRCVAVAESLLAAAGQAVAVNAQVISAPAPTSGEGVQTAVANVETGKEQGGFLPVSWPSVSLPQISMPKIGMPKWPTNADGSAVSPMAPIAAGASKVSAGARKAWEGAKEMFSFGSSEETSKSSTFAKPAAELSFWQRMTGKQAESEGPQTVAEFMSQPRIR